MKAVLFDMDGVLVDSETYWSTFEHEELFPDALPHEDIDRAGTSGMNFRDIYDYLEGEYGTEISRSEWIDRFDAAAETIYTERVSLLDGLHDLLEELDERGVHTALVSSSPHHWIEQVLERFDLEGSFDRVVSADDIDAPSKPNPGVFEHAAAELDISPATSLVVEDSENGIEAASRAGTTVVAYRIEAHGDLDYSSADHVVETPAEVRETVLEEVR
ncbi:haloacid dehalogenase superfamily, subfamily IA, variant 3 with third motif having DD or ED/haloacid dehalogenase superfamily, subfamily IA, variant 1 with third motif having Dx(3-4)D or Dx(3-4)E [Natronorubrum sediminis]|uniref:Haloacid dehalogenase superfamily, subfamily IA, variant 3 with third motif having DD or ED/haloacid dehalogenase superfamily, subfamily IA, variant 1 with third motif having Dx(3-4)D or Dx(3-4)E n=1 Tax=Natronorubrum sediminis TaxID=640943 RepID=A0A1H6G2N8_9EURY|nr:HAD family phosphatase [Natronorubrum sediminis]SEH17361.1 haloacid dehalogenase superfamily, subfamily IA, variant 3 with third motif having DD or ED/haloacid dehalogenase superfamily, subfamily IA, variant 1 with third motif having Dx(3-4)D or Dx(3-4)E [Natronorubrum sediminis]